MLTMIDWPRMALPPEAITDMASMIPTTDQPPRRAKSAISRGEVILRSKISDFGEKVTIVQALGPNARAMAIKVDAATAVGGFVTPGDHVDILLTQGGGDGSADGHDPAEHPCDRRRPECRTRRRTSPRLRGPSPSR